MIDRFWMILAAIVVYFFGDAFSSAEPEDEETCLIERVTALQEEENA